MKLVIATLLIAAAVNTAALAQYTFDAKGRRYSCLPGDWSCSVLSVRSTKAGIGLLVTDRLLTK